MMLRPRCPSRIPTASDRGKIIQRCEKLLLDILKAERGCQCEICGKHTTVGLFHILPKGRYPRIRFHKFNLLLAGWYCCHYPWHHDYYIAQERIEPRIKELRGNNYKTDLAALDSMGEKLSLHQLIFIERALGLEWQSLGGEIDAVSSRSSDRKKKKTTRRTKRKSRSLLHENKERKKP